MKANIADFSVAWQGRTIDGAFPLRQFLGGSETSAVFLTTFDAGDAAIKLLSTDPAEADGQWTQLQAAAKFSHTHLLRIFKTGRCELDGLPVLYAVMEFAEENLAQVLPERALTAAETREMLVPTLRALDYLHRQGFVHGHLKPSNIMAVADTVKLSSDGIRQASKAASAEGDIWSLGMTLTEVLTQRAQISPRDLPEPFADIVAHCMPRNAADRWTIAQISNRLAQREGEGVGAAVRRRWSAPKGVVALLALAAVAVLGVMIQRTETGRPPAPKEVAKMPEPVAAAPVTEVKPQNEVSVAATSKRKEAKKTKKTVAVSAPPAPAVADTAAAASSPDQPMPQILPEAKRSIHGKVIVNVKVDVDASGTVTSVKAEPPGGGKYFTARTLAAVHQWKFPPLVVEGRNAPQQWRLHFEFQTSGMTVQPKRIAP